MSERSLQHEAEQLEKDYDVLKELEDAFRMESDVLSKKKLEGEIKKLKKIIGEREEILRGINPLNKVLFEGWKLLRNRELDKAEEKFDEANRLEPESPEPWYWKARVAMDKGNIAVALRYVNKLLDRHVEDSNLDHWHILVLKIKLLLLSGGSEKLQAEKIVKHSRGKSATLDSWLDCLEQSQILNNLVITNSELERRCPSPDYQW